MAWNKRRGAWVLIAFSALLLGLMIALSVKWTPVLLHFAHNRGQLRGLLLGHGPAGVFAFIGLQMLQVIIAFIPGGPLQMAGGYVYGALPAAAFILAGVAAGEMVSFFVGRLLGTPIVSIFMKPERQQRFRKLFGSVRGRLLVFLLFLIPGLPKDPLSYLAGVTPLRPLTFFGLSMLARVPGILSGTFIGSSLQGGHYKTAVAVFAAVTALFALGVLFREPLLRWMERRSRRKPAARD